MARKVKLATIRQNISHLNKMIERLEKAPDVIPKHGDVKITRRGSQLIVDGKVYKPKDLEKLGKVHWNKIAVAKLESDLRKEVHRLTMSTRKDSKYIDKLGKAGKELALMGEMPTTTKEVMKFHDWLNDNSKGSVGENKWFFYHEFGGTEVDEYSVKQFLLYHSVKDVSELMENA